VLACDDEVLEEVFQFIDPPLNTVIRLPQMFLAQLRHELGWFLHLVYDYGIPVFYWAHHQFADAVRKRYLLRCVSCAISYISCCPGPGPHNIATLRSWAPNLLSSCRNFGLWLSELCSEDEVLNPEIVSVTDLAYSHYLLNLYYDYRCF